jgi:hypothetical protein
MGGGNSSCSSNATCLGPTTPTILLRPGSHTPPGTLSEMHSYGHLAKLILEPFIGDERVQISCHPSTTIKDVTAPQRVRGSGSKPHSTGQGNRQANACRKERGRRRKAAWVPRHKLCLQPGSHGPAEATVTQKAPAAVVSAIAPIAGVDWAAATQAADTTAAAVTAKAAVAAAATAPATTMKRRTRGQAKK